MITSQYKEQYEQLTILTELEVQDTFLLLIFERHCVVGCSSQNSDANRVIEYNHFEPIYLNILS